MGKIEGITASGLYVIGFGLITGAIDAFKANDYYTGTGLAVIGFGLIVTATWLVGKGVIDTVKTMAQKKEL